MDNLLIFQILVLWGVLVTAFLISRSYRRGQRATAIGQAVGLLIFLLLAYFVFPDLLTPPA